mmetsp:Transcript_21331/g.72248  ORF Transcript_21331/g.72248 Transcript_21331/m.72248 type:complete len:235 (-) Transcript_21331:980-1684(-)
MFGAGPRLWAALQHVFRAHDGDSKRLGRGRAYGRRRRDRSLRLRVHIHRPRGERDARGPARAGAHVEVFRLHQHDAQSGAGHSRRLPRRLLHREKARGPLGGLSDGCAYWGLGRVILRGAVEQRQRPRFAVDADPPAHRLYSRQRRRRGAACKRRLRRRRDARRLIPAHVFAAEFTGVCVPDARRFVRRDAGRLCEDSRRGFKQTASLGPLRGRGASGNRPRHREPGLRRRGSR